MTAPDTNYWFTSKRMGSPIHAPVMNASTCCNRLMWADCRVLGGPLVEALSPAVTPCRTPHRNWQHLIVLAPIRQCRLLGTGLPAHCAAGSPGLLAFSVLGHMLLVNRLLGSWHATYDRTWPPTQPTPHQVPSLAHTPNPTGQVELRPFAKAAQVQPGAPRNVLHSCCTSSYAVDLTRLHKSTGAR